MVVVVDDLGIEHVEDYDIGQAGEYVPLELFQQRLNELSGDHWLRIGRAWSNPLCSPTRSTIQTGRYGRSTGTGANIQYGDSHILDVTDSDLLAKNLAGYETAAFGKWHLGVDFEGADDNEPILAGFDYFERTFLRHNTTSATIPTWTTGGRRSTAPAIRMSSLSGSALKSRARGHATSWTAKLTSWSTRRRRP